MKENWFSSVSPIIHIAPLDILEKVWKEEAIEQLVSLWVCETYDQAVKILEEAEKAKHKSFSDVPEF